jgi:uncharacterized protein
MKDRQLAEIFGNALPNTLDTTILWHSDAVLGRLEGDLDVAIEGANGNSNLDAPHSSDELDAFVITGDIHAMWLRDSANQLMPYVRLATADPALGRLLSGVIRRHTKQILEDPYADAFLLTEPPQATAMHTPQISPWQSDSTTRAGFLGTRENGMTLGTWERKFEIDGIAATVRLAHRYWRATADVGPFDEKWLLAMRKAVDVWRAQQAGTDEEPEPYTFERETTRPTDTLLFGTGGPARRCGLLRSPFRPSDDASSLAFPVASNALVSIALDNIADLVEASFVHSRRRRNRVPAHHGKKSLSGESPEDFAKRTRQFSKEVRSAVLAHGVVQNDAVFAYEVDGFGNFYHMDDANIPSLLSLPYLGFVGVNDTTYQRTRQRVLSRCVCASWDSILWSLAFIILFPLADPFSMCSNRSTNPYFFSGTAGAGVGGPHVGLGYIWPMSVIMRGWTATTDAEIRLVLDTLRDVSAATGFIHESFNKNNAADFTRPWFAWANSLFGDFILHIADTRPHLIF